MISAVHGTLERMGPNWAVLRVGGFSIRVNVPALSLSRMGAPGTAVSLHTHLHLREDAITLYGFTTEEELALFQALITVSGVGPKLALGILSTYSAEQVALAIGSGNPESLTGISGVGKKIASRIVLELRDKLHKDWLDQGASAPGDSEVMAALSALGYSPSEAVQAVSQASAKPGLSLEERVTLALQFLGRQ